MSVKPVDTWYLMCELAALRAALEEIARLDEQSEAYSTDDVALRIARDALKAAVRRGKLARGLELHDLVIEAANPLSRLKLTHSAACPLMFDGGCACGVEAIEALARVAVTLSRGGQADARLAPRSD